MKCLRSKKRKKSPGITTETPVWIAAERGRTETVRMLLERNANPNLVDEQHKSPSGLLPVSGIQR